LKIKKVAWQTTDMSLFTWLTVRYL